MHFSNLEPNSLFIYPRIIPNEGVLLNIKAMIANCRHIKFFECVHISIYKKNSNTSMLYM